MTNAGSTDPQFDELTSSSVPARSGKPLCKLVSHIKFLIG